MQGNSRRVDLGVLEYTGEREQQASSVSRVVQIREVIEFCRAS